MKFDAFLHPRQQKAPLTMAGQMRNATYRLFVYKSPFFAIYCTVSFVVLPYLLYKLDKKIGLEEARKKMGKEFREHLSHRAGGTLQFESDYHYIKENLLKQWQSTEKKSK